jgi:uridine phosphorylase
MVCFFQEVISKRRQGGALETIFDDSWEDTVHRFYKLELNGQRLALFHPGVGGPIAAGMLEGVIAPGCREFIACGGAGVLDRGLVVGHIVVPQSAVRDEGASYHYLPPGREVAASPEGPAAIEQVLREHGIEYLISKTWTTDAPYRETPAKVQLRKSEGCLTVEMEAAAFFAVARFRGGDLRADALRRRRRQQQGVGPSRLGQPDLYPREAVLAGRGGLSGSVMATARKDRLDIVFESLILRRSPDAR